MAGLPGFLRPAPHFTVRSAGEKDCVGRDVFVAFCSRVVKVKINIKQKSRE
jgi:hypothetical protein